MKRGAPKESKSVVAGILGFLKDHGKSNLLSTVSAGLDEVVGKTKRADRIVVTSAVPLTRQELAKVSGVVSKFLKTPLPTSNVVDSSLIGGLSVRVGDFFLDASVARELDLMKRMLVS